LDVVVSKYIEKIAVTEVICRFPESLITPSYLSRVDRNWKIRARKQRTDVGKYSFVNRTITDWNHLTEGEIGALAGNTCSFRKRVRKVITGTAK
jgi:hypothetical protein